MNRDARSSRRSGNRARARGGSRAAERPAVRVPGFPPELPISALREEIARAIEAHQVVVVCGETGSGKTTQLPKICLAMGRGGSSGRGIIGHTQPRRIAACSVAARIADELQSPLGRHVGYKIRFTDTLGPGCSVKIMTDGILLAETRSDPLLRAYDTIIIDEAHERSLNIDFLLGYLKRILPKRPDLKVIITSATIDPRKFSVHFGGPTKAPIVEVPGRMHPIEVRFRPLVSDDPDAEDRDLRRGVLDAVDEAVAHGPGDVLVFLSGEREIRELTKALGGGASRPRGDDGIEILPLYARLTMDEQIRVFAPHPHRRIVLATNVAETSLTVPGIRYVIDSGHARISRYSARSGVQRLPIEPISRASAEQRKGRCGRIGPGVCIRLFSEEDFDSREEFTPPEILRTNLASVILQMKALKLGRIEEFPFVEPPRWGMITDGYTTLHELGAIDEWGEITKLGEELARLPIDPRLGRMILAARDEGCVNDVLVIAAALSIQDPRERPHEKQQQADEAHAMFRDENSDFVALLNLWRYFHEQSRELTQNRLRRLCRERFLSYVRLREWVDVHHQLRDLIAEAEVTAHQRAARNRKRSEDNDRSAVHRAILAGLLSRIGVKHPESHEYTGAHGRKFHLFPGSGLFKSSPQWIMAAELVETTRLYAHTAAKIAPAWLESVAGHLVKRRHAEPHYRERTADVGAMETVTLFGLEIVRNRRVPYGPIDPKASREIFIRAGLVEGRYHTNAKWKSHNQSLIEEIKRIEAKTRRRGLLVDEERLFAFYDARVPEDVYTGKHFEQWRREAERKNMKTLYLTREALLADGDRSAAIERFPDHLTVNSAKLPLEYRFEPGHEDDGVTLTVPHAILDQLSQQRIEWLVPGLLEEKIAALIKGLSKSLRRNFVPISQFAAACAQRISAADFGKGSLHASIGNALHRMTGIEIPRDAWQESPLPPHLAMNLRIVDDEGQAIAKGRDLEAIRRSLAGQRPSLTQPVTAAKSAPLPAGKHKKWSFGDLPASVIISRAGINMTAYPAIVDGGDAVSIKALPTAHEAHRETRNGLRRLIMLQFPHEMKALAEQFPGVDRMAIHFTALGLGSGNDLRKQLLAAVIGRAFLSQTEEPIRTKAAFDRLVNAGWHNTAEAIDAICDAVDRALASAMTVTSMLAELRAPNAKPSLDDISSHLNELLHPNFISETPSDQLLHLPRYVEGDRLRIVKIKSGKLSRDRQLAAEFEPLRTRYLERAAAAGHSPDRELDRHRWMLEELRVALFAQELGTVVRVSPKRLDEHWREIARP